MRRLASGIGAVALLAMASVPMPAQAQAYRYWSYWTGGEQWSYSARGPGFRVPADGAVEGWRFVVSPKDGSQAVPPDAPSSFATLCPDAAAPPAGQKRVAVVIDYGPAGIAPVGETPPARAVECVTVAANQSGLQVLQTVAELRFHSSGLICGIDGFPASECPGQAATLPSPRTSTAAPTPKPTVVTAAPAQPSEPLPSNPPDAATTSPTASASPTVAPPLTQPSPVALPVDSGTPPTSSTTPPAWIAAIGAAMIAALLGLAVLVRKGRP